MSGIIRGVLETAYSVALAANGNILVEGEGTAGRNKLVIVRYLGGNTSFSISKNNSTNSQKQNQSGYSFIRGDYITLQQNIPNPFTNTTNIGYSLNQKFTSSQIVITDKNSKPIKAINISGSKGNITIDASTLAAGAYQYSLIVNGRLIDTRQMILAK